MNIQTKIEKTSAEEIVLKITVNDKTYSIHFPKELEVNEISFLIDRFDTVVKDVAYKSFEEGQKDIKTKFNKLLQV